MDLDGAGDARGDACPMIFYVYEHWQSEGAKARWARWREAQSAPR